LTFFMTGIGGAIGPVLTGYIYDLSGSYTPAWILNFTIFLIVTFLILALKPRRPDAAA
jgi:cyanate permease